MANRAMDKYNWCSTHGCGMDSMEVKRLGEQSFDRSQNYSEVLGQTACHDCASGNVPHLDCCIVGRTEAQRIIR